MAMFPEDSNVAQLTEEHIGSFCLLYHLEEIHRNLATQAGRNLAGWARPARQEPEEAGDV